LRLPPCRATDLVLSFLVGDAAMGNGVLKFALTNTSSTTCATTGYPAVRFLDKETKPLRTIPANTTHDYFGFAPLRPLTLAPGTSVSFRLRVTHSMTSTANCRTAYGLQMTLPRDTATLRTSIPNGAYQCQKTTVIPLQRGNSAYRQ
jgi:Domain of unknown function (DUF4232)